MTIRFARWGWACLVLAIVAALAPFTWDRRTGPPIASISPAIQRVEGKVGGSKVQVRYKVENRGGEPLVLGSPATSCGCTVASIEPKVIPPGGVGVIVVNGDAPRAGERSVEIRIGTNAPAMPELTAQLVMVGVSPLPYVVASSGPINFGDLGTARGEESFYVEAHEAKAGRPWLSAARSTLPEVAVTGGLKEESDLGRGVAFRRYEFKASLDAANPLPQAYAGEVRLGSESGSLTPHSVPVRFTILPPVYARPSLLVVSFDPGSEAESQSFILNSSDRDFPLEASPSPEVLEKFEVDATPLGKGRIRFRVRPRRTPSSDLKYELLFRTNHPRTPNISVPISLRVGSG